MASGHHMTLSAHEKVELNREIVPELRTSGQNSVFVPSWDGQHDFYIDLKSDGDVDYLKTDHAAPVENILHDAPRWGVLKIDYLYRDANNFKQFGIAKFTGKLTNFRASVIYTALIAEDDSSFIPEHLGITPLQSRWGDVNYDEDGADHPYHDLELLSFEEKAVENGHSDDIGKLYSLCRG
jgi:hypothetical protein